jgi:hypothetical protein
MNQPLSKTAFLDFLFCPKNLWLKLNKPELLDQFTLSDYEQHLAEEGNEVEAYARNLFPGGIEVKAYGHEGCRETKKLMAAKVAAIFQATFIIDGSLAPNDVLAFDAKTNAWHLYEVKGTSAVHETGEDAITWTTSPSNCRYSSDRASRLVNAASSTATAFALPTSDIEQLRTVEGRNGSRFAAPFLIGLSMA